jgi:Protein of unknown function (DUF3551)
MRAFMFGLVTAGVVGLFSVATAAPAAAHDYAWCLQGPGVGIPGDCFYQSYAQCQASASGRYAYCNVNPRAAYARIPRRWRGAPDPYADRFE